MTWDATSISAVSVAIGAVLKTAIDGMSGKRKDMLDQLQVALARIVALEKRCDEQQAEITELYSSIAAAEEKAADARQKYAVIEAHFADKDGQIELWRSRCAALERKCAECEIKKFHLERMERRLEEKP